jgi:nitrilase
MPPTTLRAAVAQTSSLLFNTPATLLRVEDLCRRAAAQSAHLLVLPEAMLGGYPRGLTFGATLGQRTPQGRELFRRYADSALRIPGPETEYLAALARELSLHIVTGAIERDGHTLYCVALVFAPDRGLILKHRKLMPTGTERLLWGLGGGADLHIAETEIGRIGTAICWENYMPEYRQHLYRQGVELWCAPTVDPREIWQSTMRHIAYEGRCFVLSSCQRLTQADWPEDLQEESKTGEIDGRSLIVNPQGELLAGPTANADLLFATLDLHDIPRGKFDLDVAGHYSRPDLFPPR